MNKPQPQPTSGPKGGEVEIRNDDNGKRFEKVERPRPEPHKDKK